MSRIPNLGKDLERLPDFISEYEQDIVDAKKHIAIDGKSLALANKEQASWQVYYAMRRSEVYVVLKYMEFLVEKTRGRLFKSYTERGNRDLSDRAKERYIDNEDIYLSKHELYLEVKEIYDKFDAIVDGFKSRGFALNNLTRLRIESLENETV